MDIETIVGAAAVAGLATARRCSNDPDAPYEPTAVVDRRDAARLLTQATFGPTVDEIDALVELGDVGAWIDQQVAAPISRTLPYVRANSNGSLEPPRHHIWWANALEGPDQLRQRVAFALSEIFVVSDTDYEISNAQYGISGYYDMLAEEAFGDFRTLLERVTLHPVMGIYLSMLRNERADPARNIRPDENFAREVLQLFTIGLWELRPDGTRRTDASGDPIPTYDQATVEEFAKVFTGWNLSDADVWTSNDLTKFDKEQPMVAWEEYHDTSAKTLLGGVVLPAGQSARADLDAALDNIVAHPNVGPFVATALIRRLVSSNPTRFYVGRVAEVFDDNGAGQRGDLRAVVAAVLTDPEARLGDIADPQRQGKLKEPIMRLTQLWRAFGAQPGPDAASGEYRHSIKALDQIGAWIGQAPLESPSVFNFFLPENPLTPGGDLVAPEAQILTETNVSSVNNLLYLQIFENTAVSDPGTTILIDIDRELAMASAPRRLVEHLDLLLMSGSLPLAFVDAIVAHIESMPIDPDGAAQRVGEAIACIVVSPFHMVQK